MSLSCLISEFILSLELEKIFLSDFCFKYCDIGIIIFLLNKSYTAVSNPNCIDG